MAFLYGLVYLIMIAVPVGLVVWQMIIKKDEVRGDTIAWLAVIIAIFIVIESVFGRTGQLALTVEKMAAISALISLFSVVAAIIIGTRGNQWIWVALITSVLALIFFTLAGGYRNFLEALCHFVGQRCFTGVTMYLR